MAVSVFGDTNSGFLFVDDEAGVRCVNVNPESGGIFLVNNLPTVKGDTWQIVTGPNTNFFNNGGAAREVSGLVVGSSLVKWNAQVLLKTVNETP